MAPIYVQEDVDFHPSPVVSSYLSFWVRYKLCTCIVAYSCCSWDCISKIIKITTANTEF